MMNYIMFMVDKIQKNVLGENLEECMHSGVDAIITDDADIAVGIA